MPTRSVLISGASIAGPALAYWLHRYGFRTTIVERADQLRLGGQNIDLRGAGRAVARRMGIEAELFAASTGEQGVRFVDARDRTIAEFPAGTDATGGATAELEILRGELARILYEHTRATSEYIFGDQITHLHDRPDHITATFKRAAPRSFDLVIAADGIRSRPRALVFADEPKIRELGLLTAYLTIPRVATDSAWARWYNAPGGRSITLRPDNLGTTRATLSFLSAPRHADTLEQQRDLLQRSFHDAGWEAPRILAAVQQSTDLYFDSIGQVLAPSWSRGRFALAGDAAHCPSPISGMGTTLALVGAYILAGELHRHRDHKAAFAAYEQRLRPYVTRAQQLPPGAPRIAHPRTRAGILLFNTALRIAASRPARALGGQLFAPPADTLELPDYDAPAAA